VGLPRGRAEPLKDGVLHVDNDECCCHIPLPTLNLADALRTGLAQMSLR
jgi:hypothetical protein